MGAAVGAASSAVQMAIAGGGWDDILRSGLTGAATGAIGAAAAWGLGQMFDQAISSAFKKGDWARGVGLTAVRGAGDAAVGGGISEFTGGNFKDGFIGSGVSSVLSPAFGAIPGLNKSVAGRTAVAAVIGGTASELTGGKFANGAMSAAFTHLFNEEVAALSKAQVEKQALALSSDMATYFKANPGKARPTSPEEIALIMLYDYDRLVSGVDFESPLLDDYLLAMEDFDGIFFSPSLIKGRFELTRTIVDPDLTKGMVFTGSDLNYHLQGMAEASRHPTWDFGQMTGLVDRIGLWNVAQAAGRRSTYDLRQIKPGITWAQIGYLSVRGMQRIGRVGPSRKMIYQQDSAREATR